MKVDKHRQDYPKGRHSEREEGNVIADMTAMDGAQAPNGYGHWASEHVLAGPVAGKRKESQKQCRRSCGQRPSQSFSYGRALFLGWRYGDPGMFQYARLVAGAILHDDSGGAGGILNARRQPNGNGEQDQD